jgi:hypothetical protein
MNTGPVDVNAFSLSRKVDKPNPKSFMKRGTGTGGLADSEAKKVGQRCRPFSICSFVCGPRKSL